MRCFDRLPQDTFRLFLSNALALCAALSACSHARATTFYVRGDGGDASQCTGRVDAAYSGSGQAQACAWKHPALALPTSDVARIAGGDTLIIGAGNYMIGWGAPDAASSRCASSYPWDCFLAAVPSGPSANAPTRILGRGYDNACPAPPQLWGTERVHKVLNLDGSSNVEIGCLEITDHSDCVEFHSDSASRCERDSAPYGAWASAGLTASASSHVWLHDLNIHGLANVGVYAGGLDNWTVERVRIAANGWVGWNGDIGSGSSNSGPIVLSHVEIAWNGCGERWQTGVIHACWAQQAGGYGDGLGTASTGGQWLVEDSYIHHNTSDGLDLLYLDGAPTTSVVVRRVRAEGNAGNQIKTRGAALIENSIVDGNCAYFLGRDAMTADDQCRAFGNTLSIGLVAGQTATIRHNTITGEGDCLLLTTGGSATSHVMVQNNALIGQIDWRGAQGTPGELTCGHYAEDDQAVVEFSGNAFWHVKYDQCPPGSQCAQNPQLSDMSLASFNAQPLTGSPLIDAAPSLSAVTDDYFRHPRPTGPAADIGAIEVQPSGDLIFANGFEDAL